MQISLNLVLAVVLAATGLPPVIFRSWHDRRYERVEVLRLVSGCVVFLLVPVNLVFAWMGRGTPFNVAVMIISFAAFCALVAMRVVMQEPTSPALPTLPVEPAAQPRGRKLRVLAVGVDPGSFDAARIDVFANASHDVFALALGDTTRHHVLHANRTFIVGLPLEELPGLGAEVRDAVREHLQSVEPDLVLAPSPEGADHPHALAFRSTREVVGEEALLLYPTTGSKQEPQWYHEPTDVIFRRPDETMASDRITMPSFADPRP